jgi:hypothetical protein
MRYGSARNSGSIGVVMSIVPSKDHSRKAMKLTQMKLPLFKLN